jgi:tetratricopeptide (TPR) repeat protein
VSTITFEESWRQISELTAAAEEADRDGPVDVAIVRWQAVAGHPCAYHAVALDEVFDQIHQMLRQVGRYDEAIEAKRQAIASGYRSMPDAEADIAECLLAAGRRVEADRLYAELRARDPEDVWLNNSAAYGYGGIDDREALRWSLDGIELAMATGDPEQVIMQLLECAERSWSALGEPADELLCERVETFVREWTPPPRKDRWGAISSPPLPPCPHCGWDPETLPPPTEVADILSMLRGLANTSTPERVESGSASVMSTSIAWFPAPEWQEAVRRWPDLLDGLPEDHREYSHEVEARTKRVAAVTAGVRLHISPFTVQGLVAYAHERNEDPGTAKARSREAAELPRLDEAVAWPPGRNDPCWCGSGVKYKKCCGPVARP